MIAISIFGGIYTFGFASQIVVDAKKQEYRTLGDMATRLSDEAEQLKKQLRALPTPFEEDRSASAPAQRSGRDAGAEYAHSPAAQAVKEREVSDQVRAQRQQSEFLKAQIGSVQAAEANARQQLRDALAPTNDLVVLTIATKIGAVLLLLFFVRILVSIFRYYSRLSIFYQSRADALLLSSTDLPMSLAELANLVSPEKVDFDKTTDSPEPLSFPLLKELEALRGKAAG